MLMGSSPAELTLGLMPFTDKADADEANCGGHARKKASKQLELEHYLKSLEEEKKKIEAFKRELPFCMALLTTGTKNLSVCLLCFPHCALHGFVW
jgi:hypothetical protein